MTVARSASAIAKDAKNHSAASLEYGLDAEMGWLERM